MADSHEVRKGDKLLGVVEDDLRHDVVAAVARDRLEKDVEALEKRPSGDDDALGCDC